jgi:hypothetical protein
MTVQRGRQGWLFQPLTLIRQTGTLRAPDGSTTYTFVALVHPDLPPVKLTLLVTARETLRATACFDETIQIERGGVE